MKLLKFTAAIIYLLLTGCVAAVVAGAAAGAVVYDRRSLTMIESDARIFYVINKAIVSDSKFHYSRISVSSFNEIVLLVGQTNSVYLRSEAEKIARRTPQVKRVYNELTVGNVIPISQQTRDAWITSQIRSHMLTRKGLESGSIKIVTENGAVYLMGIATHEQADLAVDAARHVPGVIKVVKVFRYII